MLKFYIHTKDKDGICYCDELKSTFDIRKILYVGLLIKTSNIDFFDKDRTILRIERV